MIELNVPELGAGRRHLLPAFTENDFSCRERVRLFYSRPASLGFYSLHHSEDLIFFFVCVCFHAFVIKNYKSLNVFSF